MAHNTLEDNQNGTIMAFVYELGGFVTKALLFGMRTMVMMVVTWIELLRGFIYFQLNALWTIVVWMIAFLSLPARALAALQRENMLEMRVIELQTALDNMLWQLPKLETRLRMAIKERKLAEGLLAELKKEHESAMRKMKLLECELRSLKIGTHKAKEVEPEEVTYRGCPEPCPKAIHDAPNPGTLVLKSSYNGEEVRGQYVRSRLKPETNDVRKQALPSRDSTKPPSHDVLKERRNTAISLSLFSSVLSLFVGMIMWEAKDPCMPLVVALFSVVGISLFGVVQFLSTIHNKPAVDAVALLSLNWFVLGILTYPTLPKVAEALSPTFARAAGAVAMWFVGLLF